MKSRCIAILSLILFAIFQQSVTANSIDCDNRGQQYLYWTQEYFDLADVVFFGKVISEETLDTRTRTLSAPANVSSMSELLEDIEAGQSSTRQPSPLQTATFEVEKFWKGPTSSTMDIKADLFLDDTGRWPVLTAGDTYLVFAFKTDEKEIFHVPIGCTSHESDKETATKIRVLDALVKKPGDR